MQVMGESRYTAQEVIDASGILFGEHLFFINKEAVGQEIQSRLPYIGHVELRRRFPNRVEITVGETFPVAQMRVGNGYLILDRDAKILEQLDAPPLMRLIESTGLPDPISPQAGDILYLGQDGQDDLRYLRDILGVLSALRLSDYVSHVDMTELYNPSLLYDGRLTVYLGPNLNLRHKMDMLVDIVSNLGENERGTIDLSLEQPNFISQEGD